MVSFDSHLTKDIHCTSKFCWWNWRQYLPQYTVTHNLTVQVFRV